MTSLLAKSKYWKDIFCIYRNLPILSTIYSFKKINLIYVALSKYSKYAQEQNPKMHLTLSLKSLKTGYSLMKNFHSVLEGHQCPGSFQEVGEIF